MFLLSIFLSSIIFIDILTLFSIGFRMFKMFKVTEKSRSLKLYNIELINNYIKILLSLSGMMVIIGISKPSIYDHINVVVVAYSLFIATGTPNLDLFGYNNKEKLMGKN